MFVLIDNYDSFTYNLFHYLGELGAEVVVHRNDQISVDDVLALAPEGVILSPGPCTPDDAGICLELVERCAGILPILGVCLGHQSIAQAMGGKVVRAPYLMHGKVSKIIHEGRGLFAGLPSPFEATRYHSLVADHDTFPDCLEITAQTEDGIIMGLSHREHEIHGVQFHPESIASQHGHDLLRNFLERARSHPRPKAA
jgi:anthranilate synthase component II